MCWISCGVYGRVRVSLGYCQILISQIGLSGGPSDHRLITAWHHINSICIGFVGGRLKTGQWWSIQNQPLIWLVKRVRVVLARRVFVLG